MPLTSGARIGPYEVVDLLGQGGMGQVYRARDAKLDRFVALKVLPEQWSKDPDRLARFDREARVLASINHPNIAAIYGREQAGDLEALVLELVEGPGLDDLIKTGPIPVDEAVQMARQIAQALEAAHGQGILHRDLKPGNVKVRTDGTVKILDFGLARAIEPASADGASNAATITSPMTQLGVILGTAAYMAPEQAKGRRVDERADIWAFGCVLFEMLTGRRTFEGDDVTETLASIVKSEPDWNALPPDVPSRVRRLLRRCLRKDMTQRLRHIGDARLELDDAADDTSPPPTPPAGGRRFTTREIAAWSLALVAAVTAGWLAMSRRTAGAPVTTPMSFQLGELEAGGLFTQPVEFSLSPDGQHIAFSARSAGANTSSIWIRSLSSPAPRQLAGTEGGVSPFWSPDSRTVAFGASGQLRKIAIDGGLPQKVADRAPIAGGSWSENGTIVFAAHPHLFRVSSTGGVAQQITTDEEIATDGLYRWPAFLPDGRHFVAVTTRKEEATLLSLDSSERKPLFATSSKVVPSDAGYLLFVRDEVLLAQPFDMATRVSTGEAAPLAERIRTLSFSGNNRGGGADFTVSRNGTLFYRTGGDPDNELVWVDREGKRTGVIGKPAGYAGTSISPDGRHVAFHIHTSQGGDVHVFELARGAQSQVTFKPGQHAVSPFWIGNNRLGFAVYQGRANDLFFTRLPALDRQQTLIVAGASSDAASDGSRVIWQKDALVMSEIGSQSEPVRIANGSYPDFSPDGRWITYHSGVSGRLEIYIQSLTPGSEPIRVSTGGGAKPRWGADESEVFYMGPDAELMAAPVRFKGPRPEIGTPVMLFKPDFACTSCAYVPFDVGTGNQKFLIVANVAGRPATTPATLVFDWPRLGRR